MRRIGSGCNRTPRHSRGHLLDPVRIILTNNETPKLTLIVREVVLHRADGQLLLEPIDLVEEEDDRCLHKPPRVADRVEEGKRFLHTVDGLIFEKELIILRDGDKEENGGDILKAMYSLLPFRPLATHIEHTVGKVTNDESSLSDTSSLNTGSKDILIIGNIIRSCDAVDGVEVAGQLIRISVVQRANEWGWSVGLWKLLTIWLNR